MVNNSVKKKKKRTKDLDRHFSEKATVQGVYKPNGTHKVLKEKRFKNT